VSEFEELKKELDFFFYQKGMGDAGGSTNTGSRAASVLILPARLAYSR